MIDEHELLSVWATGGIRGTQAFNQLYAKYSKKVMRDARRLSNTPEDTAQSVWLSLTRAMKDGRIPGYASLEEYLYRLTQMESRYSREKDTKWGWAKTLNNDLVTPDVSTAVETGQMTERLNTAIDTMPKKVRDAWAYKRLGHDENFACKQLKLPGRTYRRRLAEARAILKSTIEELN